MKKKNIICIALGLYVSLSFLTGCTTYTLWTEVGVSVIKPSFETLEVQYEEGKSIVYEYDAYKHQQYIPFFKDKKIHVVKRLDNKSIGNQLIKDKYKLDDNNIEHFEMDRVVRKKGSLPLYFPVSWLIYPDETCVIYQCDGYEKPPYIYIPVSKDNRYGEYKKFVLSIDRKEFHEWRIPLRLLLTPITITVDAVTLPIQFVYAVAVGNAISNAMH